MDSGASRIACFGDGLKFGYINKPMYATVHTNDATPGELKAYCDGPILEAHCTFTNKIDGTYLLTIIPKEVGLHHLHIKYNDHPIPNFPKMIKISAASNVNIYGSGLHSRLLSAAINDGGRFQINTGDVDPGSINVKIGGPTGSFKLKTQLDKRDVNLLTCFYNPKEVGLYVVSVSYDGIIVPDSPYQIYLALNLDDLKRFNNRQTSEA